MRNVAEAADEIGESRFDALPERVQVALGELAGAAKEGLLALSVGVGLGVLTELMAEDVVGPKGRLCRVPREPPASHRRPVAIHANSSSTLLQSSVQSSYRGASASSRSSSRARCAQ